MLESCILKLISFTTILENKKHTRLLCPKKALKWEWKGDDRRWRGETRSELTSDLWRITDNRIQKFCPNTYLSKVPIYITMYENIAPLRKRKLVWDCSKGPEKVCIYGKMWAASNCFCDWLSLSEWEGMIRPADSPFKWLCKREDLEVLQATGGTTLTPMWEYCRLGHLSSQVQSTGEGALSQVTTLIENPESTGPLRCSLLALWHKNTLVH